MSRAICGVLFLIIIGAANATSMCVPKSTLTPVYSRLQAQENGNRGQWVNGGSCVADAATNTVVCSVVPTIRGEAHCGASGGYPADNWEQGGYFCWCRLTHIKSTNGYMAPRNGGWVLFSDDRTVAQCSYNCAYYCAQYAASSMAFYRVLFAVSSVE